jgi:predicted nucleic acid-binding protein
MLEAAHGGGDPSGEAAAGIASMPLTDELRRTSSGPGVQGGTQAVTSGDARSGSQARVTTAVIDTNVLFDWLIFDDPRLDPLRSALAEGRLRWITCAAMLGEFDHVLGREPLKARVIDRARVDHLIQTHARLVEHDHKPSPPGWPRLTPRCSDPDDQIFIDLAITQGTQLLLTRDRALLKLARKALPHGVWVTTPERWAARP